MKFMYQKFLYRMKFFEWNLIPWHFFKRLASELITLQPRTRVSVTVVETPFAADLYISLMRSKKRADPSVLYKRGLPRSGLYALYGRTIGQSAEPLPSIEADRWESDRLNASEYLVKPQIPFWILGFPFLVLSGERWSHPLRTRSPLLTRLYEPDGLRWSRTDLFVNELFLDPLWMKT